MKLYIALPLLYNNIQLTNALGQSPRESTDWFINNNIVFTATRGTLPFNFWNGDINYNFGDLLLYDQLQSLRKQNRLAFRFDLSNLNLTTFNWQDRRLNTILETFNTGSNELIISDLLFFEFLQTKFPNYDYIFSENAYYSNPYTPEILNDILAQPNISLVELPITLNTDTDFISKIDSSLKSKLEVCVQTTPICPKHLECRKEEQLYIYNFSSRSIYKNCGKCRTYANGIAIPNPNELLQNYSAAGFSNIRLQNILPVDIEVSKFILFFMKLFIKPEYHLTFIDYLVDRGIKI